MAWRPVTSPLAGGTTTLELLGLKIERQPRTSPGLLPLSGILMLVQFRAPIKSCPFDPNSIRSWKPSVITADPLTVIELRSMTFTMPQVVAAVPEPQEVAGGV